MQYWRMQLHPAESHKAMLYSVQSLGAGFIGLDFGNDPGDLLRTDRRSPDEGSNDFGGFARQMAVGDRVLIVVHHHPFALTTVAGEYNYMREPAPELGVWFRHFRRVQDTRYYADLVTNPTDWERLVMTDTISTLKDPQSKSFQLIERWSGADKVSA